MRPVVSYDDISLPVATVELSALRPQHSQPPPPKKRRKSNHQRHSQHAQHWDDPGNADEAMSYNDTETTGADISAMKDEGEIEEEEEEESRELSYEEIWDDSVLIDAWNAATEEYEAYHGTDKSWKNEPTNKSPLWYNVPPSSSRLKKATIPAEAGPASNANTSTNKEVKQKTDDNSQPLNFDTFIPTHDPSLALPEPPYPSHGSVPDYSGYHLPEPPGPMVSQDEAFTRALGAMYWAGYYSAVYHCHRNKRPAEDDETEDQDYEEDQIEKQEEGNEAFIPTQR